MAILNPKHYKSMKRFPVTPEKERALYHKMSELAIKEEDIEETFVRSSGRGGQNVNKTSTCVQLKHAPTGVIVKCSKERSQSLNRYHARVTLIEKIEKMLKDKESEQMQKIHKIRKQKRKRSKRAQEKVLAEKRFVSEKKRLRSAVQEDLG